MPSLVATKAPVIREHPLQRQIADILRIELAPPGRVSKHGVVWWAVDAANYGGAVPAIRTGRGVVAGVPDMFMLYRGRAYHIEIKSDDGTLSAAQQMVCAAILTSGGRLGIVRSAAELLDCMDQWGVPRAQRVTL